MHAAVAMRISINRGTPPNYAASLCDTCRHSHIVRGRTQDEELVFCDLAMRSVQITFKVTSCSHYDDQRHASYLQLMHQAWILRPASRGRAAGFVPASELEDEEFGRSFKLPRRNE
jgi:hypothetical protein